MWTFLYFIDIAFHDLHYELNKLFDYKMGNKKNGLQPLGQHKLPLDNENVTVPPRSYKMSTMLVGLIIIIYVGLACSFSPKWQKEEFLYCLHEFIHSFPPPPHILSQDPEDTPRSQWQMSSLPSPNCGWYENSCAVSLRERQAKLGGGAM